LKYTLVPIIASLRWHVTNVGWKWILRGNMDFTFSGSITAIPRGPETHYYSFDFGIRRNFVYRNWKVVPFFEQRGGAGIINAKEPLGVQFAQGQNLTFTYNLGVGARYNLNSKYSFSAGMNYMHISNGYLSEPQFTNYGINVYGPMFGMDVRLGKPRASQ
jgi:Lipid A 3-O-deacylase (PagL)